MKLRILFSALAAAGVAVVSATAQAAPATPCSPAAMIPKATQVPVNFNGFAYSAIQATASNVHLRLAAGGADVPLTVGPAAAGLLPVVPTAPLTVGASYILSFDSFCTYGMYPPQDPIAFTVTPASPVPTKLGAILGVPQVTVKDFGTTEYTITASYSVDADMAPWLASYQLLLVLDGVPFATVPTLTAAGDRVDAVGTGWCDAATAATNSHKLQLRGATANAPAVDTDATILEFACPAPAFSTPPNVPLTRPPVVSSSSSGGASTGGTRAGGCAMRAGDGVAPVSGALFAAALGLGALVRRRLSVAKAATRRR